MTQPRVVNYGTSDAPLWKCLRCERTLPSCEFNINRARSNGLDTRCKLCSRRSQLDWISANRERRNRTRRAWNAANKEHVATREKDKKAKKKSLYPRLYADAAAKSRSRDPKRFWVKAVLGQSKIRAKRKRVPHTLTFEQLLDKLVDRCPVLGIELDYRVLSRGAAVNSPSLDRVYPQLGYTAENTVVVSWRANAIKRDATPQELSALANYYVKFPLP